MPWRLPASGVRLPGLDALEVPARFGEVRLQSNGLAELVGRAATRTVDMTKKQDLVVVF